MIRTLIPIVLLAIAVGVFAWFIDPSYERIKVARATVVQYDEALNKSRELQTIRDELLRTRNAFLEIDKRRLEKLLPNSIDNVRLILDIDSVAARYALRIRNTNITETASRREGAVGSDDSPLGSAVINFSVAASYTDFVRFLKDLEASLRIVDVTGITFSARDGDLTEFTVSVKTYWLR